MDRIKAVQLTKSMLEQHGLNDYKVRIDPNESKFGAIHYEFPYKLVVLNGLYVDVHGEPEILDTIKHEIAHAIVGNKHGHDDVWKAKARELGTHTGPCAAVPQHILDAIRSGHLVEVTYEPESVKTIVEETILKPKYQVTRLQDLCTTCGKVAKEKFSFETLNRETGNTEKWTTLECFHIIKKVLPRGTPFETLVSNGWKAEIASCKHTWGDGIEIPKTQCTKCEEFKLYAFQDKSCRFGEAGLTTQKGILFAHEMGLGKTVIALAIIKYLSDDLTPTLYTVKSKTRFQWLKEIMRWIGPSHLGQIINSSRDTLLPGLKSYIISYDLLRKFDRSKIEALGIKCVVLDECQQIKNVDSGRTQQVRKIVGNPNCKVIGLSGTPWKNRGEELFPILNMIAPQKFYSQQHFLTNWVDYYFHGNIRKQGGIRRIPQFKEYTKDLILRYEFDEVMEDAPAVKRMKLSVQLDEIAMEQYDDATSDFVDWYNQHLIDGTEDKVGGIELLAQMARMRHIVGLAKIAATVEYCDEFYENTNKSIVIFTEHLDVMYHLKEELKKLFKDKPDVHVDTLSAQQTDQENNVVSSKFNSDGRRWFVVASTKACGEGIDGLQKGCDAILHERQWNPQNEDQAAPGRFKRIGQKSPSINVTCVEADETIDLDLSSIIEQKRKWFHDLHNKGEVVKWDEGAIAQELANRIVARFKKKGKSVKNKNIKKLASKNSPVNTMEMEL